MQEYRDFLQNEEWPEEKRELEISLLNNMNAKCHKSITFEYFKEDLKTYAHYFLKAEPIICIMK